MVTFNVPPQEILTKDSVTIHVDAVVFYSLSDPLKAVIQVANYRYSTQLLAQATLRNIIGTKILMELLTGKDVLAGAMQSVLDEATEPWGVKVQRVEM